MTIKEAIGKAKENGTFSAVPHEPTSADVYFRGEGGSYDATQFDLYAEDKETELDELFTQFCQENRFRSDTVTAVELLGYIA